MLQHVYWNLDGKPEVLNALDHVLLELQEDLEQHCRFSDEWDTRENKKKLDSSFRTFMKKANLGDIPPATPEELDTDLDRARNTTCAQLGHREKRILDIRALRKAVAEDKATPSDLKLAQEVLISSIMRAIFKNHWPEVESGNNIMLYADALINGFCVAEWDCFPYDELPTKSSE